MRWLPELGVGVVALANKTYASMHLPVDAALACITRAAEPTRQRLQPTAPLLVARDGIARLLDEWDDALADELFADNFFADQAREHWRHSFVALKDAHVAFAQPDGFAVPNRLRGRFRIAATRGALDVWLTLAPTRIPKIQFLRFFSILPPSARMLELFDLVVGAVNEAQRVDEVLAQVASPASRAAIEPTLMLARARCGTLRKGALLSSDGETRAAWRLHGAGQDFELELVVDADSCLVACDFSR